MGKFKLKSAIFAFVYANEAMTYKSQGFLRMYLMKRRKTQARRAILCRLESLIQRLNCIDIGSTSEQIYLVFVKQGFICELYAGVSCI